MRNFKPDEVPKELVMELLAYATMAPSACNRQAWRFILVDQPAVKRRLVDAGGSALIDKAPCGILVTYANTTRNTEYHDDAQSAAACIQNLLLAAHAHGLGACWLCTLPSKGYLRKLFGIPSHYSPVAYVILGYPSSETVHDVPRLHPIEQIVGQNRFPTESAEPRKARALVWGERVLVCVYRRLPAFIRRRFVSKVVDNRFTRKFDN